MRFKKYTFIFILLVSAAGEIYSLPRFALRYLDKCSSCHFNNSGGGMRNENGYIFGKNVISMISPRDEKFPIPPRLSENVSFGFDYRSQFLYSQQKKRTDFQDMTGTIYLNAAVSEKIDVTARYDFIWALWEGYAAARILPNESYIKVGSFSPNFGIRLDDHTSYTRGGDYGLLFSTGTARGLIYNPLYLETGIELGANISDQISFTASVGKSRANSTFAADPAWTTRLEFSPTIEKVGLLFGGSYTSTKTKSFDRLSGALSYLPTQLYGGFAGIGYKKFSLMGEYDLADDYLNAGSRSSAMMIEAAYQIIVGLEAVVRYDRFDPDTAKGRDEFAHLILGLEFYPYSFIEVRPQYRINIEDPDISNDAFVLQFHFWY